MDILSQDIMYLPGVGPHRKEILGKELGIHTYRDLLEYFPYKYVDRTKLYLISKLSQDMPFVQIKGRILSFEETEMGKRKKRIVTLMMLLSCSSMTWVCNPSMSQQRR